jgi:hypothetical protein
MIRETAGESALELAAKRLERAIAALEQRLSLVREPAGGDMFERQEAVSGGGALAEELERARTRERELEAAGAEASAALGRAIQEIRAALNGAAHAER